MLMSRVSLAVVVCLLVLLPRSLAWADDADESQSGSSAAEERAALEQRVADLEAELAELKDMLRALVPSGEAAAPPAATEPEEEDYPTSDWSGDAVVEYRHIFGQPGAVSTGRISRQYITVRGDLSDDTSYKIDVDTAGAGKDLLRDAYIRYRASSSSTWTLGQFKPPQGYAQFLSNLDQPLPARPLVSDDATWNGFRSYRLATSWQLGAQYQYREDEHTLQAAVFGGVGRNALDENSNKDMVLRYQYSDSDSRHQAALSYRFGQQYDGSVAGNYLQTWGLEYRYHGEKHWVEAEWMAGQARGDGALVDEYGGYVQWIYWPDGTKRYAVWPEAGSGDEFWALRLERLGRTHYPGSRVSLAWLGYTRFIEDDWKAQLALAYQRDEQRLYLTNYWRF